MDLLGTEGVDFTHYTILIGKLHLIATKNIIIHHMTKSPKIHLHGVYFLYNSPFGLALNRLVPGGKKNI